MKNIFESGTSSVLLKSVPTKTFHCRRGVRQGESLSPLIFVLAVDFLQTLVNKAVEEDHLNLPIPDTSDLHFPIIQYADDTIIIMEGCLRQLQILKKYPGGVLNGGLKVKYSKSMMISTPRT